MLCVSAEGNSTYCHYSSFLVRHKRSIFAPMEEWCIRTNASLLLVLWRQKTWKMTIYEWESILLELRTRARARTCEIIFRPLTSSGFKAKTKIQSTELLKSLWHLPRFMWPWELGGWVRRSAWSIEFIRKGHLALCICPSSWSCLLPMKKVQWLQSVSHSIVQTPHSSPDSRVSRSRLQSLQSSVSRDFANEAKSVAGNHWLRLSIGNICDWQYFLCSKMAFWIRNRENSHYFQYLSLGGSHNIRYPL